ncbi:hypothetical protein GCM10027053_07000 [Intrasporangium mesophilum]
MKGRSSTIALRRHSAPDVRRLALAQGGLRAALRWTALVVSSVTPRRAVAPESGWSVWLVTLDGSCRMVNPEVNLGRSRAFIVWHSLAA